MDSGDQMVDPFARQLTALRRYRASAERFTSVMGKAVGLHSTDVAALNHVLDAHKSGRRISPSELGQMLALSGPATTAVIDRLERAGYVNRRHSTTDGRRVEIDLAPSVDTRPGSSPLAAFGDALRDSLSGFTAEQLDVFEVILTTLANRLESQAQQLEQDQRARRY